MKKRTDICLAETSLCRGSLQGSVAVSSAELLQNMTKPYFMHYSYVEGQSFAKALTVVHSGFHAPAPN